jgi:hypothetical protein
VIKSITRFITQNLKVNKENAAARGHPEGDPSLTQRLAAPHGILRSGAILGRNGPMEVSLCVSSPDRVRDEAKGAAMNKLSQMKDSY